MTLVPTHSLPGLQFPRRPRLGAAPWPRPLWAPQHRLCLPCRFPGHHRRAEPSGVDFEPPAPALALGLPWPGRGWGGATQEPEPGGVSSELPPAGTGRWDHPLGWPSLPTSASGSSRPSDASLPHGLSPALSPHCALGAQAGPASWAPVSSVKRVGDRLSGALGVTHFRQGSEQQGGRQPASQEMDRPGLGRGHQLPRGEGVGCQLAPKVSSGSHSIQPSARRALDQAC